VYHVRNHLEGSQKTTKTKGRMNKTKIKEQDKIRKKGKMDGRKEKQTYLVTGGFFTK
jgi:hypothetical protein